MANPITTQDGANAEPGVVTLDLQFTAGSSGAFPATVTRGKEFNVATCTKVASSTGLYDLFLRETWLYLLNENVKVIQASYSASGAVHGFVTVDSVNSTTAPKVRVTFRTAAGAAVDLASGDIVRVTLRLQNVQP